MTPSDSPLYEDPITFTPSSSSLVSKDFRDGKGSYGSISLRGYDPKDFRTKDAVNALEARDKQQQEETIREYPNRVAAFHRVPTTGPNAWGLTPKQWELFRIDEVGKFFRELRAESDKENLRKISIAHRNEHGEETSYPSEKLIAYLRRPSSKLSALFSSSGETISTSDKKGKLQLPSDLGGEYPNTETLDSFVQKLSDHSDSSPIEEMLLALKALGQSSLVRLDVENAEITHIDAKTLFHFRNDSQASWSPVKKILSTQTPETGYTISGTLGSVSPEALTLELEKPPQSFLKRLGAPDQTREISYSIQALRSFSAPIEEEGIMRPVPIYECASKGDKLTIHFDKTLTPERIEWSRQRSHEQHQKKRKLEEYQIQPTLPALSGKQSNISFLRDKHLNTSWSEVKNQRISLNEGKLQGIEHDSEYAHITGDIMEYAFPSSFLRQACEKNNISMDMMRAKPHKILISLDKDHNYVSGKISESPQQSISSTAFSRNT